MFVIGGDCFSVHFTIEAAITWVLNVSEVPSFEILMLIPWHNREVLGTRNGTLWKEVRTLGLTPLDGILTSKLFLSLFDSWPPSGG